MAPQLPDSSNARMARMLLGAGLEGGGAELSSLVGAEFMLLVEN